MTQRNKKIILVIEDDKKTADLIALYLQNEGFKPVKAFDGESGLMLAKTHYPDLVILDLMLPKIDGWEVCRQIRKASNVPIIMLTARGEEIDRVSGLTLGADDYVVKPFSPRELIARVRAILRRTSKTDGSLSSHLKHGKIILDLEKRQLMVGGQNVPLTRHEYVLLKTLMSVPGKVFSRNELLDRLYPRDETVVIDRVVDVHIGKLRQKIEDAAFDQKYIQTVRGIGYRFSNEEIDGNGAEP